jgi:hypothetical protein
MALGAGGEVDDKRGGDGLVAISILELVRIGFAGSWFCLCPLERDTRTLQTVQMQKNQTIKLAMNSATTDYK